MPGQAVAEPVSSKPPIDFLWLELTNQCNLQCTHCYADSGPQAQKGTISASQYIQLMTEAYTLGCRSVQFIGGEPTLNRDLPALIRSASKIGFEFIEVFTNLTRLSEELLQCFVENGVHVATSVYGAVSDRHDAITLVNGSFEQTTRNLQRVVKTGLPVRAAITEMEENAGHSDSTVAFLRKIGVENVSVGRLRHFGRGAATRADCDMSELCGNCAGGTLCVSPTGQVSPCIMSKQWAVGSIAETSLSEIATGNSLLETRRRIHEAVADRSTHAGCAPSVSDRVECHPAFNSVADRPILANCHPAVSDDRVECHPRFGGTLTVSDRVECHPAFNSVADRPILANCHPAVSDDRLECHPRFGGTLTVSDRVECHPVFSPATDRPTQTGATGSAVLDRALSLVDGLA